MTSYFSDIVRDLKDRTEIATKALMESEATAEVSVQIEKVDEELQGRQSISLCPRE